MVGTSSRGPGTALASVLWYLSVVCFLSGDAADCLVTDAASLGAGLAAGGAIDLVEVVDAALEAGLVGSVIVEVTVVVADAEGAAAAGLLWARC